MLPLMAVIIFDLLQYVFTLYFFREVKKHDR